MAPIRSVRIFQPAARRIVIALVAIAISGCFLGAHGRRLASEAASSPTVTAFIADPARMTASKSVPFEKSWIAPGVDLRAYPDVEIAPVSLEYLRAPANIDQSDSASADQKKAALDAAIYLPDSITDAINRNSARRLNVVSKAGPHVVVIEIAIVAMSPTHASTGVTALSLPALVKPSGARSPKADPGFISIEVRMRDGATGEVIATFADTRDATAPRADDTAAMGYGFANEIIDGWSTDIVRVLDATPSR